MKPLPIGRVIEGERILGIEPPLARAPDAGWRQRLNLFPGRQLTQAALELEQTGRDGHLALLARALSAGVVKGLEVNLVTAGEPAAQIDLAAGWGLTTGGQIVTVDRARRLRLADIPLFGPAGLVDPGGRAAPEQWVVGRSLAELPEVELPPVMVLLAQPLRIRQDGNSGATTEDCGDDAEAEAFRNRQWVDGCRLLLHLWPEGDNPGGAGLGPLPQRDERWRNRLAFTLFRHARQRGGHLPWDRMGLALALLGLDEARRPLFADRHAVVRRGGELCPVGLPFERIAKHGHEEGGAGPRPRFPSRGERGLWRARFEQFNRELAQWLADVAAEPAGLEARARFRHLPPVGVLPTGTLVPGQGRQRFFPAHYQVELVALPLDQVELAIEESASLAGFDLMAATPERVEVVVPVPPARFDPELLFQARPAADFDEALARFERRRGHWLARREVVRQALSRLTRALRGEPLEFPEPDPNAIDELEPAIDFRTVLAEAAGVAPLRAEFILEGDLEAGHLHALEVEAPKGTDFRVWLNDRLLARGRGHGNSQTQPLGDLMGILREGENRLRLVLDPAGQRARLRLVEREPDFGVTAAGVLALDELKQRLPGGLFDGALWQRLDEQGLERFITFLEQAIAQGDDTVDFGFLRMRTEMYRIRQIILGSEEATKLATSPVLAEIAKGESAMATRQELADFYQRLKQKPRSDEDAGQASSTSTDSVSIAPELVWSAVFPTSQALFRDGVGRRRDDKEDDETRKSKGFAGLYRAGYRFDPERVIGQNPLVGKSAVLRNVTVAERLKESAAQLAYQAALALRVELLERLRQWPLSLSGLMALEGVSDDRPDILFESLGDDHLSQVIQGDYDPVADASDESALFDAAVQALERVAALLRRFEGRLGAYRVAVRSCEQVAQRLREQLTEAARRLETIEQGLAEARHDLSAARVLRGQEQARVDAINARRAEVLANEVPFLLFRRPRGMSQRPGARWRPLAAEPPSRQVSPCEVRAEELPEALIEALELLRRMPLAWLRDGPALLERLRRPAPLRRLLRKARMQQEASPVPEQRVAVSAGIQTLLSRQWQRAGQWRQAGLLAEPALIDRLGWRALLRQAPASVTLGDLMGEEQSDAGQRARGRYHSLAAALGCLHGAFSALPPVIRLAWAERLSQFDEAVDLRRLTALPRFADLDSVTRHDLQLRVDQVFAAIRPDEAPARELMSELVRVTLLLASAAPVDRILAGRLDAPARLEQGSELRVVADPAQVRAGMEVSLGQGQALARVVDIDAQEVVVRVTAVARPGMELAVGTRVQFFNRALISQRRVGRV